VQVPIKIKNSGKNMKKNFCVLTKNFGVKTKNFGVKTKNFCVRTVFSGVRHLGHNSSTRLLPLGHKVNVNGLSNIIIVHAGFN
jgi:hypothetical protein